MQFTFDTELTWLDSNQSHTVLLVPEEIINKLPTKGIVRLEGTINNTNFNLAVQKSSLGIKYLMIGGALRRQAKLKTGENVKVHCQIADNLKIEYPEELLEVLAQDEKADAVFNTLTIGYRRSITHYVNSVKSTDSRIKRALELAEKMKNGTLFGMRKKKSSG